MRVLREPHGKELRPPANNQHPLAMHVRVSPRKWVVWPQASLQMIAAPADTLTANSWETLSQKNPAKLLLNFQSKGTVWACLKLLNMELLHSNGKLMQLKLSFLSHSVTTSRAVYWESTEKAVTTILYQSMSPKLSTATNILSSLLRLSPFWELCDWDCFHKYIYCLRILSFLECGVTSGGQRIVASKFNICRGPSNPPQVQ